MQNSPFSLPFVGESSRAVLILYRLAACVFCGWITMLLLVPDPYATSQAFEPIRRAQLNGYAIHLTVYTLTAAFMLSSLRVRGSAVWTGFVWLLLSHACMTEVLQMHVPGRSADIFDAAANICGIAMGTIVDFRLRQLFRRDSLNPSELRLPHAVATGHQS